MSVTDNGSGGEGATTDPEEADEEADEEEARPVSLESLSTLDASDEEEDEDADAAAPPRPGDWVLAGDSGRFFERVGGGGVEALFRDGGMTILFPPPSRPGKGGGGADDSFSA